MGGVGSGAKPKVYSASAVDRVRDLYESGMTQAEIARWLRMSQKVIWRLMRNHGIDARPQTPRDQWGPNNSGWKGEGALYQALHLRVERRRGKPSVCGMCGTTDLAKTYDWANLTGRYTDSSDYARMCRSCHRQYDKARGGDA